MTSLFKSRRFPVAASRWLLAGMLLCATWSHAEEPPAKPRRKENRFLFVIDSASAMKDRGRGVEEAVIGLLDSGMKGELRKGDTIGLWTYSDRLKTDFPMQVWSEQKRDDIRNTVRDCLRDLRYEKRAHLEKALPAINQVVAHSERLTVVLIFDGYDPIKGTSFDQDINALHKKYAREFRAANEPFVTVLAARNGEVFDYTINYPNTVVIPHTADPLPPPETNAPPSVAVSTPPPAEIIPPPAEPKPPPQKVIINLSGSDFVHNPPAPPPAVNTVVPVVIPTPAPAPTPPHAPVVLSSAPPPVEAPPVAVQTAQTDVAAPAPTPTPPPAAATPPPATVVETPVKPIPVVPAPRPAPVAVAPAAPAVAAVSTLQQTAMFIMALSLLTIAVVLVLFLVRRSRGGPQASLISQSIDRSR